MIIIQLLTITLSFLVLYVAIRVHFTYIQATEFYSMQKIKNEKKDKELLWLNNALVEVRTEREKKKEEIDNRCGKDSTKECTFCDGDCPFRKGGVK